MFRSLLTHSISGSGIADDGEGMMLKMVLVTTVTSLVKVRA